MIMQFLLTWGFRSQIVSESDALIVPTIPPVKFNLSDVPSIEEPVTEIARFLSSLDQEIEAAFQTPNPNPGVKKEEIVDDEKPSFKMKSICAMSAYQVNNQFKYNLIITQL